MLPLTLLKAGSPIARTSPIVKNKPLKINGINILRRVRSAHRLPLLVMHKMHPTDNYSARNSKQLAARSSKAQSPNARRVRSAHRLPLLVMHKMHSTDNYSARKLKSSKLEATRSSAHRLPLLVMHKMHPTDNYSARNSKQLKCP
jgi:hypothetical protein